MQMTLLQLGERIGKLRTDMGLTQLELALRCGVEQSFIHGLESGRKSPSFSTLNRLATAFEMSLSDFLADCEGFTYNESMNKAITYLLTLDDQTREKAITILKVVHEIASPAKISSSNSDASIDSI